MSKKIPQAVWAAMSEATQKEMLSLGFTPKESKEVVAMGEATKKLALGKQEPGIYLVTTDGEAYYFGKTSPYQHERIGKVMQMHGMWERISKEERKRMKEEAAGSGGNGKNTGATSRKMAAVTV